MKRNGKYNARKTTIDGISFDSMAEAERYGELKLMQQAGYITGLRVHPVYELQPAFVGREGERVSAVTYEGDFEFYENGVLVCEDVKGFQTDVFRVKSKLFKHQYPNIDFRISSAK